MSRFKVVAETNFNDSADAGLFIPQWAMENVTNTHEGYGNEAETSWAWETDDPKTVAALEAALQAAPGILSYDTIEEREDEESQRDEGERVRVVSNRFAPHPFETTLTQFYTDVKEIGWEKPALHRDGAYYVDDITGEQVLEVI